LVSRLVGMYHMEMIVEKPAATGSEAVAQEAN